MSATAMQQPPEPAGADPVIALKNIDKAFGSHVVYRDMNLDMPRGETTTIIGGSGTGKSVCMKMIIGLLKPDRGQVLVRGQDVTTLDEKGLREVRRHVAYVFQGGALFDSMTVGENVGFGLREQEEEEDKVRERAGECLELVGLDAELLDEMPTNLSGGMRKRVALARSIALSPEVILYDEPTTGLDPKNIAHIGEMIMKLQRELQVTSVVVTHDMSMAFKVSDRIAMIHDCAFPYVGTPEELAHSEVAEVRNFVQGRIEDE